MITTRRWRRTSRAILTPHSGAGDNPAAAGLEARRGPVPTRSALVDRARVGGAAADGARRSTAPSRGQWRSAPRVQVAGVRAAAPAEDPQRVRIARCKSLRSLGVESTGWPGRARCPPATALSSTRRLPRPGDARWSMSTALTGARRRRARRELCAASASNASGPSRSSSGSSSTAPSRRGSRSMRAPPSAKRTPKRCHAGTSPVARVEQRVAGRLAVDQHPSAHAEMQPEHRTAGIARCRRGSACRAAARP